MLKHLAGRSVPSQVSCSIGVSLNGSTSLADILSLIASPSNQVLSSREKTAVRTRGRFGKRSGRRDKLGRANKKSQVISLFDLASPVIRLLSSRVALTLGIEIVPRVTGESKVLGIYTTAAREREREREEAKERERKERQSECGLKLRLADLVVVLDAEDSIPRAHDYSRGHRPKSA